MCEKKCSRDRRVGRWFRGGGLFSVFVNGRGYIKVGFSEE